ncbi:MAG TPA: hypothetical protein VGV93_01225 [Acidimicrobiales bacterium]|nr:hypothetical protein [Acidimicrobiales bacterium]
MRSKPYFFRPSNDFLDLLFDAASGRGRPATRAARTLFEHELDALDVEADSELATRWLDHLPMAGLAQAKMSLPEKHLHGKALKGFRHAGMLVDGELWPTSAPSNSGALIVREPTGEATWFEYLPDQFLARKARTHEVTIHDEQERALTGLLEEVPSAFPHGRVGVCLHGAVVAEPGDGPWVEAPHLVDFPLFHIYEDGAVGAPSDVTSPP